MILFTPVCPVFRIVKCLEICATDVRCDLTLQSEVIFRALAQSTQNICITFVQCWTNVEEIGPALYIWYTNVLCLLVEEGLIGKCWKMSLMSDIRERDMKDLMCTNYFAYYLTNY